MPVNVQLNTGMLYEKTVEALDGFPPDKIHTTICRQLEQRWIILI